MDKSTLENALVMVPLSVGISFLGVNTLFYHMVYSYHKRRLAQEKLGKFINEYNTKTSRGVAEEELKTIGSQDWFTRNILRLGEKLAYKRFLRRNV